LVYPETKEVERTKEMKRLIQILGPTGVGKSKIAIRLAKRFKGEVISADSMQVYQGFNIGTDKVKIRDRQNIPHHLIDVFGDCRQFNASIFLEMSHQIAEEILRKGGIPITCGGTALYLKVMNHGIFPESKRERISRSKLEAIIASVGSERLWKRLYSIDPDYAGKISMNDQVRIIRAMEIYYNNGIPPSEIFKQTKTPFHDYRFIRIGLTLPRDLLYSKIEKRVDSMIAEGLVDEVIELKKKYCPDCPPFKSMGYKETLLYLEGLYTLNKMGEMIKQRSRNFAKRQLSWFRQENDIAWFLPDRFSDILDYLETQLRV